MRALHSWGFVHVGGAGPGDEAAATDRGPAKAPYGGLNRVRFEGYPRSKRLPGTPRFWGVLHHVAPGPAQ